MLGKAFLFLSALLVVRAAQSDFYSDLSLFHELQQPYRANWNWHNPVVNPRRAIEEELASAEDDSDEREPLAKDYKDPPAASSEQKPVLVPKPKPNLKSIPEKPEISDLPENPERPLTELLPGGVVDVNSDGFGGPFNPFGPEFDFSSSFGVGNSKPFGIGDLFNSFQGSQWWKGKRRHQDPVDVEIISSPNAFNFHAVNKFRPGQRGGLDVFKTKPLDIDAFNFDSVGKLRPGQGGGLDVFKTKPLDIDAFNFHFVNKLRPGEKGGLDVFKTKPLDLDAFNFHYGNKLRPGQSGGLDVFKTKPLDLDMFIVRRNKREYKPKTGKKIFIDWDKFLE